MTPTAGPSRRGFLSSLGVGAAGVLAAGGGYGVARATSTDQGATPDLADLRSPVVPFYGQHQAGIGTQQQDRLVFAAFDVTPGATVADLRTLLRSWSAAAARMCAGETAGPAETLDAAPTSDTGEVVGLPPNRLTITVGFGASLFDKRFGLRNRRPAALVDLPRFGTDGAIEAIDASRSNGDICVQACADDPLVAFHAVRNLSRIAVGTASLRWSQSGLSRTSRTVDSQQTARNLMGFKHGTDNVLGDDAAQMNAFVWVGDETDQPWMHGGSYCVTRRIKMLLENWDTSPLADQELTIGRRRDSGAPLSGGQEFDKVELAATDQTGRPLIPTDAHIRLAAASSNGGQQILRRGYSFQDGIDPVTGGYEAGMFFIGYQQDPRRGFIPIQTRLAAADALNQYIKHTASGVYAMAPGVSEAGDYFGRGLLG